MGLVQNVWNKLLKRKNHKTYGAAGFWEYFTVIFDEPWMFKSRNFKTYTHTREVDWNKTKHPKHKNWIYWRHDKYMSWHCLKSSVLWLFSRVSVFCILLLTLLQENKLC